MRKFIAFLMFEYHYLAYQIPMKLMYRELGKTQENVHGKESEFRKHGLSTIKYIRIVNKHQAYCDKYRAIIEG